MDVKTGPWNRYQKRTCLVPKLSSAGESANLAQDRFIRTIAGCCFQFAHPVATPIAVNVIARATTPPHSESADYGISSVR